MSPFHADRNLLFGILAVQMDFITRDTLITAMNAWVLDKSKSLGDILTAQQVLPSKRRLLLDSLVEEHLEQHDCDAEKSLAAVGADVIARSRLDEVVDDDVQASLVRSLRQDDAGPLQLSTAAYQPPSTDSRFVPLRPHAKGGLGEVFVARDEELQREVALKEIQARHSHDADSRARFVQEAEITGKLEHPGIVPVYGFGVHADGRPYYAMRLIRGESLKEALQRFHKTEHATASERTLAMRKLLGSFLAVCQALSYAHSRGILHRDVKPDNIMLGKYGETLVVDWGLAKPLAQLREAGARETSLAEGPLVPSGSGSAQTMAGSALGTPAYMSPEQAAGRLDLLTPASDVYSLGATLYCLLTGRAPFAGKDVGEVLRHAQTGEFARPRELDRRIPAALEAVCVKAMTREPKDRYSSAQELATDLEHWLADEPVRAYREPWTTRLGRWSRRHRALVTGAAALLVTAVVALAVGLVVVDAERGEKAKAHAQAEVQRLRAEANFRQARQAVDTYFNQVSEERLLNEPGMQPLRKKLLQAALEYYKEFEQQRSDDPTLRLDLAYAYFRWGTIIGEIGDKKEAKPVLRKAIDLFETLHQEQPKEHDIRRGLARSYAVMTYLQVFSSEPDLAEQSAKQAIEHLKRLQADHPDASEYPRLLGRCHDLIGISRVLRGQQTSAEPFFLTAIALLEQAVRDFPTDLETKRLLALAHNNSGALNHFLGNSMKREQGARRSIAVNRELAKQYATSLTIRVDLGRSLSGLADVLGERGHMTAAKSAAFEASELLHQLTNENPTVNVYRQQLATSQTRLGRAYTGRGQTGLALQYLQQAIKQQAPFEAGLAKYAMDDFAETYYYLSYLKKECGQITDALTACNRAITMFEQHLREQPEDGFRRHRHLMFTQQQLWINAERKPESIKELIAKQIQAIQRVRALTQQFPDNCYFQMEEASSQIRLAELQLIGKTPADALPSLDQGLAVLMKLTGTEPDNYRAQQLHAHAHAVRSHALKELGKPTEALQVAQQAVSLLERLAKDDPAYLPDLACRRAICSTLIGYGKQELSIEEAAQRKQYAEQAMTALREAVAAGFDNVYKLHNDPNLEPLRSRVDFQELIRQAELIGKTPVN